MMFANFGCTLLYLFLVVNWSQGSTFSRKSFNKLGSPPVLGGTELPPEEWITQSVDNFDQSDKRTWSQRYFTNNKYFHSNANTVFLMLGGEGEISPEWMVAGSWIDYAKEYRALCFQLEHRFYGKSRPTDDLGVKNLKFLTSDQALEDAAKFIKKMNAKYELPPHVKWVVFGGSYPGSLAAWMRRNYPQLVHAAVSSSGPLLAKADFMEYYSVVVEALRTSSDECVTEIQSGTQKLGVLLQHMVGRRTIDKKFRLCDPLEMASNLDVSSLYETLASNFAGVVQYNKDNRIGKSAKLANITIDVVCRLMTDNSAGSSLDRLANVNAMLMQANNETCLDYTYNKLIEGYRNVAWNGPDAEGGRQWMYQTCNEFGFYQTSGGEPEIFSNLFPIEFFTQQCVDIFGSRFNADNLNSAIDKTNAKYGALDIDSTRIIFVHGSIDPWHILGLTQTTENNSPAIYIKGTAHCANMYPARPEDLPHLKAARVMIAETLGVWLIEEK